MSNVDRRIVELQFHNFDCSIEEITNLIGLEPTRIKKKGKIPRPNAAPFFENQWTYAVEVKNNDFHIDDLVNEFIENH